MCRVSASLEVQNVKYNWVFEQQHFPYLFFITFEIYLDIKYLKLVKYFKLELSPYFIKIKE